MATQRTVGICVSYNGVLLQDCEILEWDHRLDYDEAGTFRWDCVRLTVASMVVSNARLSPETQVTQSALYPERVHPSQAHAVPGSVPSGLTGLLTTDNLLRIITLLRTPRADFAMWINNASEDDDFSTNTTAEGTVTVNETPKPSRVRSVSGGSRRFILSACGFPGGEANPSSINESTENEYLMIYDPWKNLDDRVRSGIKKRDVLDCDNGPKPISVSPIPMAGGKSFRLVFTIEICRLPQTYFTKPSTDSSSEGIRSANDVARWFNHGSIHYSPVIYNRWSLTDSEDDSGRVSHTITGKLVVSDIRYKPNAMRLMAFPLAFPFARRVSKRYTVSEDGKTLLYEFTYVHAGAAPPNGVRDYVATYSEQYGMVPALMHGSMNIKVKGWYHRSTDNPNTEVSEKTQKMILLRQAHTILFARIRGVAAKLTPIPGQDPKVVTLLDMQVIEQVGVPELDLRVKVQYGTENGDMSEMMLRLQNLGAPFFEGQPQQIAPYDPKWWPIDNEWGRLLSWDNLNPVYLKSEGLFHQDAEDYTGNGADYANNFNVSIHSRPNSARPVPGITSLPDPQRIEATSENLAIGSGFLDGSRAGWAEQDGSGVTFNDTNASVTTNPLNQPAFSAVVSQSLNGNVMASLTQNGSSANDVLNFASLGTTGIFDRDQALGMYSYIDYDSEIGSIGDTGVVSIPLSASRELAGGELRSSASSIRPKETSAMIRLFAGSGERVVTVKAERINKWPDIPQPAEQILRYENVSGNNGSGETPIVVAIERLVKKEMIQDSPKPLKSGNGVVYTVNMRLVYKSTRPFCPSQAQAGFQSVDVFPFPQNRQLKTDDATLIASRSTQANTMTVAPFS